MKIIELTYIINNHTFKESFNAHLKFFSFINLVETLSNINISDYEIFYMNTKLGLKFYKFPIIDIVRIDETPVFYFYKVENFLKSLNLKPVKSYLNDSIVNTSKIEANNNKGNKKVTINVNNNSNINDGTNKTNTMPNLSKSTNDTNRYSNQMIDIIITKTNSDILGKLLNKDTKDNKDNKAFKDSNQANSTKSKINSTNSNSNTTSKIKLSDFQVQKDKSIKASFTSLTYALEVFKELNELKKNNKELLISDVKLKIQNKSDPKMKWENTNFYNTLDIRQDEYINKCSNLITLPSTVPQNKKKKNLRRDSQNIQNSLYKGLNNKSSNTINSSVSLLKSREFSGASFKKIRNDLSFDDRSEYINNINPPFISIADPYVDINILNLNQKLEKDRNPDPNVPFNNATGNNLSYKKNDRLPIIYSSQIRKKFSELEVQKKFSTKIFGDKKLNSYKKPMLKQQASISKKDRLIISKSKEHIDLVNSVNKELDKKQINLKTFKDNIQASLKNDIIYKETNKNVEEVKRRRERLDSGKDVSLEYYDDYREVNKNDYDLKRSEMRKSIIKNKINNSNAISSKNQSVKRNVNNRYNSGDYNKSSSINNSANNINTMTVESKKESKNVNANAKTELNKNNKGIKTNNNNNNIVNTTTNKHNKDDEIDSKLVTSNTLKTVDTNATSNIVKKKDSSNKISPTSNRIKIASRTKVSVKN